jgi:ABC-type nitrate/sulfonate/bicarbonate transport system substrate-binding protein
MMRPAAQRLVFSLLVALMGAIHAPGSAPAQKVNTAYISTTPGTSTVIQVAKDARIFDKHGIDATVIFISGSVRGIQAILAGEIPIGEGGGPGLASARIAGGDVIAVAGNVNVLPYYLVSHPSIKRQEELKGKIGGTHIAGHHRGVRAQSRFEKNRPRPTEGCELTGDRRRHRAHGRIAKGHRAIHGGH